MQTTTNQPPGGELSQHFIMGKILDFMKSGQNLYEDGLTLDFIWQGVDLDIVNEKWVDLPDNDKVDRVNKALELLETKGFVSSRMIAAKREQRSYCDDINRPTLTKRVRTYKADRYRTFP